MAKDKPKLQVKVFSPYETYYAGEAVSLSAANGTGAFDVLPGHINFFSLLYKGQVKIDTGYQKLEFPLVRGIIRVTADTVTVFANV